MSLRLHETNNSAAVWRHLFSRLRVSLQMRDEIGQHAVDRARNVAESTFHKPADIVL